MARKPRPQAEGSIYHVLSRGNNKESIFNEKADYHYFLSKLFDRKRKYNFELYCYAILPNHFHLLIKPSVNASLSIIMKSLLVTYSQYYNRKYSRVGHVFQDRFKSFICLRDTYLVTLISYIHQNPKRANLVQDSEDYPYSSLKYYLEDKEIDLLDKAFVIYFLQESFGRKGTVLIKKLS